MKLLLVLCVMLLGVWLWRRGRTATSERQGPAAPQGPSSPASSPAVAQMVQCRHCQVHLPSEDAVQGVLGFYCSQAHRAAAGDKAPNH